MHKFLLLLLLSATLAFAADDPWAKVKDLKTGTELRIIKLALSSPSWQRWTS
jgi:hypothetical protein